MTKSIDFTGQWKNTKGSVLDIIQSGSDIKGTFQSAKGDVPDNAINNVIGYAKKDSISFIANFYPNSMHTAFVGIIDNDDPLQFTVLWHLVKDQPKNQDPDEELEPWERVLAGGDTFTKI